MQPIACNPARHAGQILAIFNEAIATSTALYDYHPRTPEHMRAWFQAKTDGGFPVIGLESDEGRLLGFASYGTFRAWPAYKYTVEHSVYVHPAHRGQGLGERLMRLLISEAGNRGVHVLVGVIDATNEASQALHRRLGFEHTGTIRQAGFKFGAWLDVAFYQLILPHSPSHPVDG